MQLSSGLMSRYAGYTKVRIHLQIPGCYCHEPLISHLVSDFGLAVNITGAMAKHHPNEQNYFDLELRGMPQRISDALAYLKSLDLKIVGKPNSDGDEWHY